MLQSTTRHSVTFCLGMVATMSSSTVGCAGTEGPLVVRDHSGGTVVDAAVIDSGSALPRLASDISWQVQLSGTFDASVDVALYYIDLDNLTSAERTALVDSGRHMACYLSAGSYESWRPDAAAFPSSVIGIALADYPNERWLDIRSTAVTSLMSARLDQFKLDGCKSVAVANVTTSESTGFDVTSTDQTNYLGWLSGEIHQRGLLAGLATAEDRLGAMEPIFDWAYAQMCWVTNRCSDYAPFVAASKAVLAVEFGDASTAAAICSGISGSGINLLVKSENLGAGRIACPP